MVPSYFVEKYRLKSQNSLFSSNKLSYLKNRKKLIRIKRFVKPRNHDKNSAIFPEATKRAFPNIIVAFWT